MPVGKTKIELIKGDITQTNVDAIVNAANTTLLGGGGVDGAIHRAAGPKLLEACRKLSGCLTGQAKITKGYNLAARFVIHAVGPVWRGGNNNEKEFLNSCYRVSLALAKEYNLKSIAFPCISCGAYRFPIELAAACAIETVKIFIEDNLQALEKIVFVVFSDRGFEVYNNLLKKESEEH
ncbi:MAG: O-acetyl-ADP-ribose deacetylase [Candidatus Omnitrophica bacterium]|nr:O-acetyl-ADP-ribose deacetylase [Candidatus Omnitrophota bacterium]